MALSSLRGDSIQERCEITDWLRELVTPPKDEQLHFPSPSDTLKRRWSLREMGSDSDTPTKHPRIDSTGTQNRLGVQAVVLPSLTNRTTLSADSRVARGYRSPTSTSTSTPSAISSTDSTNSDRKRKRAGSPSKQLASFKRLSYSVRPSKINLVRDMPVSMQELSKSMRDVERARRIIPRGCDEQLGPLLEDDAEEEQWLFADDEDYCDQAPDAAFVQHIMRQVDDNIVLARSEAMWNCNVHSPLLEKAIHLSRHRERIRWENITTATIESSTLPQNLPNSRLNIASKKADFAYTLVLDKELEQRLATCGIDSVSHTLYEPLRYSPTAVSFETKLPGESWAEANLQLTTWAFAHVTKLRQLLQNAGCPLTSIPALPLVVVQGAEWKFLYMQVDPQGAVIWSHILIGDAGTAKGVCQIVAGLQRLITWSTDVYRPWFEQNIISPLLANT